ncbi:MAG TPA: CDP-alcohol phosphatidyltransferase family protein [Kofleriaceae bacterium]|nr:CDP-alcohol phosphatidyltransferase family protein [Kofleriaceae bacterium]
MSDASDEQSRESLHTWSLAMAGASLVAMAAWIAAPRALAPTAMTLAYGGWTLVAFGYLFARIRGHRRAADLVTGARVLLCVVLFASHSLEPSPAWWKVAVAIAIIALDAVDGWVARRAGPSEVGAVFDMESDAFYLVTMCGIAYLYLGVHPVVFVMGALRPLYVVGWAVLRLFVEPRSPNRKGTRLGRVVHFATVVALIADLSPALPVGAKTAIAGAGSALILYSYAIHIWRWA